MPKETNLELKVGFFVLLALVSLTVFVFSITGSSVLKNGKSLRVLFGFANGVKKNAPVRIAGVDEGIVKDIHLFFDREDGRTKAELFLWIRKDTMIPADSTITINQLGMLGEKYVEIFPGVDVKRFLQEGQMIIGKDPVSQESISLKIMSAADKVEQTVTGVNRIIANEETIDSINTTFKNLSSMTGNINEIVSSLKTGKGTLGHLFYDERLYDNLEGLTADLKANPWKILYRPKESSRKK